jgi:hypothetical protein
VETPALRLFTGRDLPGRVIPQGTDAADPDAVRLQLLHGRVTLTPPRN